MKTLAIISFGMTTGIVSAACGIGVMTDPMLYIMINLPAVVCFVATINTLEK